MSSIEVIDQRTSERVGGVAVKNRVSIVTILDDLPFCERA